MPSVCTRHQIESVWHVFTWLYAYMDQLWHLEPIWSGTFTNLAINVLSGHFLGWSTPNKSGEHCVVYNSALHASDHELLAFSSHFARRFYFSPPKSATFLCEEIKITPFFGRGHHRFCFSWLIFDRCFHATKQFNCITFQPTSVELFRMNFGVRRKVTKTRLFGSMYSTGQDFPTRNGTRISFFMVKETKLLAL